MLTEVRTENNFSSRPETKKRKGGGKDQRLGQIQGKKMPGISSGYIGGDSNSRQLNANCHNRRKEGRRKTRRREEGKSTPRALSECLDLKGERKK